MSAISEKLVNHENRLSNLEKNDGHTSEKLDKILEERIPGLEKSIASLSVKITTMSVINVGAIIVALALQRVLK